MALATSTDHGNNLQTVQMLIKKNQVHTHTRTHARTHARTRAQRQTDTEIFSGPSQANL